MPVIPMCHNIHIDKCTDAPFNTTVHLLLHVLVYLQQWFPTIYHLRTPWQPLYINYTHHISKMFVINLVVVISNLYVATVNLNCRSHWPRGLRPLDCCDRGFESNRGHGYLSVVCCQVEVSATS
jgi:hypothetical protein